MTELPARTMISDHGHRLAVLPSAYFDRCIEQDFPIVLRWLRDHVGKPSEMLGRGGAVCPFVPAALNSNALEFRFRYEVDGHDPGVIERLLGAELRIFKATADAPDSSGRSLVSLLVVLPDTDELGWESIDRCHKGLKDLAIDHGLMIGQFHPTCREPAVRNPDFLVSRAPMAMIAIRHMAEHDILFLDTEKNWFEQYHKRFRNQHANGKVRDPYIKEVYGNARRRFRYDDADARWLSGRE